MLVDGHLRAELTGDDEVPVAVLDLTEAEADKMLATFDPIGALGETDNSLLHSLLEGIETESDAVATLLKNLAKDNPVPRAGLTDPDAVPEDVEPTTKPGDLWLLGEHRLLCGDAREGDDFGLLMEGEKAAAIWTDPPYGVEYEGKTKDALRLANDAASGLPDLLEAAFGTSTHFLRPGAAFYIARPAGALSVTFGNAILAAGWHFHEELQWVKDSMVLGHSDYHLRHETIVYGWLPGSERAWYAGRSETSVFDIPRPKASPDHPTGKPVALVEAHLANSTAHGDLVLDPFLGSGTTMIACEKLGRSAYCLEIEPRYVDVAVRRWEEFTGREAERCPS